METFNKLDKATTFDDPERLPQEVEAPQWQHANKSFWERNSMRYDWKDKIPHPEFSREWYEEIDKRFLGVTYQTMPWKKIPFDNMLDFEQLKGMDVLEIGVGNGTHAQLIAAHAKSYTGIDLTEYGSGSTRRRLEAFGIKGKVLQMDAEQLSFPDASFDLVWSWGVIHHSSNTGRILEQIHRVLRPGGKAIIMVYYRSWWGYYGKGLLVGLMGGDFFRGKSIHQINQHLTDGALARFYKISTWDKFVNPLFKVDYTFISGNKAEVLLLPPGRLKNLLLNLMPNALAGFLLRRLLMGSFLISQISKR